MGGTRDSLHALADSIVEMLLTSGKLGDKLYKPSLNRLPHYANMGKTQFSTPGLVALTLPSGLSLQLRPLFQKSPIRDSPLGHPMPTQMRFRCLANASEGNSSNSSAGAPLTSLALKGFDSDDGETCTFDEILTFYKGMHNIKETKTRGDRKFKVLASAQHIRRSISRDPKRKRGHSRGVGLCPAALTAKIKSAATINALLDTHRSHEGYFNHIHLSACWISLARHATQMPFG